LVAWAKQLGRKDLATLLTQNLKEEQATDKKLTAMAKKKANPTAARKQPQRGNGRAGRPRRRAA
ncbi:MAG: DUF892 family protein, partial [Rhodoplanes sp.]